MILPRLKSSIPAGFCKLNRRWSLVQRKLCILGYYDLPHTDKKVHEAFYGKYNGIVRACANSVYHHGGGGAWWDLVGTLKISLDRLKKKQKTKKKLKKEFSRVL